MMETSGLWDKGHIEAPERIGDYLDDSKGAYEELYEEDIARLESPKVVNERLGSTPLLIGHIQERRNSFVRNLKGLENEKTFDNFKEGQGLTYSGIIFRDDYENPRHCTEDGTLKTRRPMPQIKASEFVRKVSFKNRKWVFEGELNGWPGLSNLEVVSLQYIYRNKLGVYAKQYWSTTEDDTDPPFFPEAGALFFLKTPTSVRVILRAPSWTEDGYSKDNPGLIYWYSQFADEGPKLAHGRNVIRAIKETYSDREQPAAVRVSFFAHRYAKGRRKETTKDRLTYHTGLFVEWDHGEFGTVIELAWLNGLGGYGGKSNWIEDRDEPLPRLFRAMPACMIVPWKTERSEIRMIDVESRNSDEFFSFMKKYSKTRFLDPEIVQTYNVRLSYCQQEHIARYLLNYSIRDTSYSEAFRNCQTFAADFFSFLTAKKSFEPYHPLNKIMYIERRHLFLYEPSQFQKNKSSLASWAGMKEWFRKNYMENSNENEEGSVVGDMIRKVAAVFSSGTGQETTKDEEEVE